MNNFFCIINKAFLIIIVFWSALLLSMENPRQFNPKVGNFGGSALQRLSIVEDDHVMVGDGMDEEKSDWEAKFKNWKVEAQELQEKIYRRENRLAQEIGESHTAKGPYHAAFLPLTQGESEKIKQVSTQSYHAAFLPLPSIPNPASQATEEWLIKRDREAECQKKLKRIMDEQSQEIARLKKEIEENAGILATKEGRLNAAKSAMEKVSSIYVASVAGAALLWGGTAFCNKEHLAKLVYGGVAALFVPMYGSLFVVAHKYPEIESNCSITYYEREIQELNETIKSKQGLLCSLEYKQKNRYMW